MTTAPTCPLCEGPRMGDHACTRPNAYAKALALQSDLNAAGVKATFEDALQLLVAEAVERIMADKVDTTSV